MRRAELTVLPTTSIVVVTEFSFPTLLACFAVWLRFRRHTSFIAGVASGLTFTCTTASWRERRIINVSCWESIPAVHSLGNSRRHVVDVRHVMSGGDIRTRSVGFESLGDWRGVMLRERLGHTRADDPR